MTVVVATIGFGLCILALLVFPFLAACETRALLERERRRREESQPWGEVVDWRRVTADPPTLKE